MVDVAGVVAFQYPTAIPIKDYLAQDLGDGVGPILTVWNSVKLGTQPTQPQLAAIEASASYQAYITPAAVQQRSRDAGAAAITAQITERSIRAAAGVLVDEINALRQWDMSLKSAVAAAVSLANLQSLVAALPTLPDRTLAQAKTAIQNKITTGAAD